MIVLLAGTSVPTLFGGVANWRGSSLAPATLIGIGVVGCLAALALFLSMLRNHSAVGPAETLPAYKWAASTERRSVGARLVEALKGSLGSLIIYNHLAAHDEDQLAEDIAAAFRKAGWQVQPAPLIQVRITPPTGIAIELPEEIAYQPTPHLAISYIRTLIEGAMMAAGLRVGVRDRSETWTNAHACVII